MGESWLNSNRPGGLPIPHFKTYSYEQGQFLSIQFEKQILPGTFISHKTVCSVYVESVV